MAVLGYREILPRTFEHRLGGKPTAGRVYVATVDEPTATSTVIDTIGIQHGDGHPDHSTLSCDGISAEETDRQHVTVTYSYGIPEGEDNPEGDPSQPPWLQPDVWTFGSTNASVACTEHYPFNNPVNQKNMAVPLTNTAGDAIFGISRAEAELKITLTSSRLRLDLVNLKKYVNTINNAAWAGFPRHTVQFVGFSASPDSIEWQGIVQRFWRLSIDLVYRSSTHNLFLPNVGWNVIVDGKKQRAWTYVEQDGQRSKVASPHPVALNAAGGFLCGPGQDGAPDYGGDTSYPDDGTDYFGS